MLYVIIYESLPLMDPELQMVWIVAGVSTSVDVLWSSCFWPLLKVEFWDKQTFGAAALYVCK